MERSRMKGSTAVLMAVVLAGAAIAAFIIVSWPAPQDASVAGQYAATSKASIAAVDEASKTFVCDLYVRRNDETLRIDGIVVSYANAKVDDSILEPGRIVGVTHESFHPDYPPEETCAISVSAGAPQGGIAALF